MQKASKLNQWASFKSDLGDEFKRNLLYRYRTDLENSRVQFSKYKKQTLGDKYYATNLLHSDTIEVRIFRGTLNEQAFRKNLEFVKSVADWIKVTDNNNYLDFKNYWKFAKSGNYPNLVNWVMDKDWANKVLQFPKTRVPNLNLR